MVMLRKVVAILLLAVFGLPLLSSAALGQDAEAGLPACCRRAGAHHCAMTMGERGPLANATEASTHNGEVRFRRLAERCPCCPTTPVTAHADPFSGPEQVRLMAAVFGSQAGVVAQTESRWRIARDRSRQKRGPPQILRS